MSLLFIVIEHGSQGVRLRLSRVRAGDYTLRRDTHAGGVGLGRYV